MTGGFNTNVRGIEIDVTKTLNNYYKQKKNDYSKKEFEEFLKKIGLDANYPKNTGQTQPIETGFVVSFDFDEGDDQEARGILATGLWEYQNWVQQDWSQEDLRKQAEFNNPKYLGKKYEDLLRNIWKDKLVLKSKFSIKSIGCEWSNIFSPKNKPKTSQRGGNQNFEPDYRTKYLKYKKKYINLKNTNK